ncbi:MAG: 50S ribosomal protein L24 [Candidatus Pacearchaeota archaeon]
MVKCSFCGKQVIQGRGIIFVELSGRVLNFCSSKCRKNFSLGREASKLKWITKKKNKI